MLSIFLHKITGIKVMFSIQIVDLNWRQFEKLRLTLILRWIIYVVKILILDWYICNVLFDTFNITKYSVLILYLWDRFFGSIWMKQWIINWN